ncbi:hypothetical protein Pmani_013203 [Petrolisthes manimaculis]|uniref:Uncharacterized protein n=1 Tax=Petrolisthes manimaculis TaxID=1843537 RepID=A0AAE1UEA7_9EUCA|nr:hypothetical protein Pmani_013203 [Petrolisthes manimaculis]
MMATRPLCSSTLYKAGGLGSTTHSYKNCGVELYKQLNNVLIHCVQPYNNNNNNNKLLVVEWSYTRDL